MKRLIPALLLLLFLCSCSTMTRTMRVVPTDTVEVSDTQAKPVGKTENGDLSLSLIGNKVEDGRGSFLMGITNNGETDYTFNDSSISVFGSKDSLDGPWTYLGTWNAQGYFDNEESAYKKELFWTTVGGILSVADTAMGGSSYTSVYTGWGMVTFRTDGGTPMDVAMTSFFALSATDTVAHRGKAWLEYLKNNLLFPATIEGNKSYMGWVSFSTRSKGYPFFKVEYTNQENGKVSTFLLTRKKEKKQ